jgi:two-component system LytT family response regulator
MTGTAVRVVVVDDEPLAREGVRALLEREHDVAIAAVCANGEEALAAIRGNPPDIVFLDVEMPSMNGFDVVESLDAGSVPVIVFVTAHDRYALRAFDANALDYVVKPFTDERFAAALARARERVAERRMGKTGADLHELVARLRSESDGPGGRWADRIAIRSVGRTVYVRVSDVAWIGSADYYAELHMTDGKTHLLRESMQRLEERLDPSQFARTHRTAIVNLKHVTEVRSDGTDRHVVILRSGVRVPLGKQRRAAFERALEVYTR